MRITKSSQQTLAQLAACMTSLVTADPGKIRGISWAAVVLTHFEHGYIM